MRDLVTGLLRVRLLDVRGNCWRSKATAVSPRLRRGDLLSCLAKKVGKEGAPYGLGKPSRLASHRAGVWPALRALHTATTTG
ncbi:hypothetical protein RR42_s1333 [Cupriavidus basilensis]|uniref:Uncharacterized protein n=1 Tax=Cupriavidus basilensis TaxID=68895 RepID=A0A0C4YQQ8_9BURK|nr:hypothetical protein RR42_s1333 [Cupriavidus basilensis]